jgi:hypothetical protein
MEVWRVQGEALKLTTGGLRAVNRKSNSAGSIL